MEISQEHLERLASFYLTHHRDLPWRRTDDPYAIWVSEIMLQQTRVEAVIGYYQRFLREFPTVADLARADEQLVLKLWEGLGYYSRARNLQKAARLIVSEYGGRLPDTKKELMKLPGIGAYTAGAIASIAFDRPEAAVDGNVLRVCSRLTGDERPVDLPAVKKEWNETLTALYPESGAGIWNQALMELGATVCLPSGAPLCEQCPWREDCTACRENTWGRIPAKLPKREKRVEYWTVFCILQGSRVLLVRRPDHGLLAGMYQFPHISGALSEQEAGRELEKLGFSGTRPERLSDAVHLFTHITWKMRGYLFRVKEDFLPDGFYPATLEQLQTEYPMPGAQAVYRAAAEDALAAGRI